MLHCIADIKGWSYLKLYFFFRDWRISDDDSMLSSKITPNSFLFRNFSQKSFSCSLQCLLKQCTWWLDQHFWHPFSYWPLSFLQLSILGSEDGCIDNTHCHSFSPCIPNKYYHYLLFCSCYRDSAHLKVVAQLLLS